MPIEKNIMPTYGRYDITIAAGNERIAVDTNKKTYVDFGSAIGVNSLGYSDGEWVAAVCKQVSELNSVSNYYQTNIQLELSEKITKAAGLSKLFFANSGAEANECAIKLARKYSFDKYFKPDPSQQNLWSRFNIITLKNSFHGRTLATITATGQDDFHNYFYPFVQGFIYAEPNDTEDMKAKLDGGDVCAVMIELIQGEGGVEPLEKTYVAQLAKLCAEKDVLLIVDEIQTGVGRTGKFLASELYGIKPDVVTLAKGLAGGLPMGVCVAGEKCADVLSVGTHGSTFGGNPIVCAGANVILNKVTAADFLADVTAKGERIKSSLLKNEEVESVSGEGLMVGIKLKTKSAKDVAKKCHENGLLILTAKDKLRLLPPLNISYQELEKGLKILLDSIRAC